MKHFNCVTHDFNIYKERSLNECLKNSKVHFEFAKVTYINVIDLSIKDHMLFDGNILDLGLRIKSLPIKPIIIIQSVKLFQLPKEILSKLEFQLDDTNKDWIAELVYKFSLGEHQIYAKYQTNWLYHALLENEVD